MARFNGSSHTSFMPPPAAGLACVEKGIQRMGYSLWINLLMIAQARLIV
jgi:hypothetical protein